MRRRYRVIAFALPVFCAAPIGSAFAADPTIAASENTVRLGVGAMYTSYHEDVTPQDTESGFTANFGASASILRTVLGIPDVYANVDYGFSAGNLSYRGSAFNTQTGVVSPYQTNDRAYFNRVEVSLGIGLPAQTPLGPVEIIPYLAGGYQNWFRNIGGSAGYGELYQAGLVGGGVKIDLAATDAFVLSARGEALGVIGGSLQASALPNLYGPGTVPVQGNFGPSAEERISIDADYRVRGPWHAFANIGLDHFNYSGSKVDNGYYEPISSTLQVSSLLGLAYGF